MTSLEHEFCECRVHAASFTRDVVKAKRADGNGMLVERGRKEETVLGPWAWMMEMPAHWADPGAKDE